METYEYHQILKYLYFEGYADSYKDAEELVEELTDEEFDFLYEDVFGIDEGKVPWNDPNHPLESGHTPAEKNRAKRERTGVEDPNKSQSQISDKDMERYGRMKDVDDVETSKSPKEKKTIFGKKKPEHKNLHKFKNLPFRDDKGNPQTIGNLRRTRGLPKNDATDKQSNMYQSPIHRGDKRTRGGRLDQWKGINPKESYETIISYLLDEGYADDLDSAYVILENMSEGWKTKALKSTLKTAGKVAKYGAKKLNKSKLGKRSKKFITRTALAAIGIPMIA